MESDGDSEGEVQGDQGGTQVEQNEDQEDQQSEGDVQDKSIKDVKENQDTVEEVLVRHRGKLRLLQAKEGEVSLDTLLS